MFILGVKPLQKLNNLSPSFFFKSLSSPSHSPLSPSSILYPSLFVLLLLHWKIIFLHCKYYGEKGYVENKVPDISFPLLSFNQIYLPDFVPMPTFYWKNRTLKFWNIFSKVFSKSFLPHFQDQSYATIIQPDSCASGHKKEFMKISN